MIPAGALALSVRCEIDREDVNLGGVRFATLSEADAHLGRIAEAVGELLASKHAKEREQNPLSCLRDDAQAALELKVVPLQSVLSEALRF